MPGKVATKEDLHTCPMCSGSVPHVGGTIIGPGAKGVLINGKPAALIGDTCSCTAAVAIIAQGTSRVSKQEDGVFYPSKHQFTNPLIHYKK